MNGYWVYTHTTPDGMVYVGMSCSKFNWRRWHSTAYTYTTLQPYIDKFGWENITHEVVKQGLTKQEAQKLEEELRQLYLTKGTVINIHPSGGEFSKLGEIGYRKKYYQEHKEEISKKHKQYRESHKEEFSEKHKQYYQKNKEKILDRIKRYNQEHKEEKLEYSKEYREKNKELINKKRREKKREGYKTSGLKNNGPRSKPVQQFTLDGEFVREWPSAMECERNGYIQSCISNCCRGKSKSHKGYIWRYKD